MEKQALATGIFTISDVLTADECRQLIALAERRGFQAATVNAIDGPRLDKEMRNNDRMIEDDFDLAKLLWSRIRKFVPRTLLGTRVRGLNERFRYYRYTPGQRFDWHFDGSFVRPNGEMSRLTFMIYLNEEYEGGQTRFESVSVAGKQGMALLFEHELLHEGAAVTSGVKYVLRSDVMYSDWKQLQ